MPRKNQVYLCINARLKNGMTPKDVNTFMKKAFGLSPVELSCYDSPPSSIEFESVLRYERKNPRCRKGM